MRLYAGGAVIDRQTPAARAPFFAFAARQRCASAAATDEASNKLAVQKLRRASAAQYNYAGRAAIGRRESFGSKAMATDHLGSFDAIWETVRFWAPEDRRSLASKLLASLAAKDAAPSMAASPADLIGAWRGAGPLDDASVQALLEDELLRKHA